jgi:hypothetical protein
VKPWTPLAPANKEEEEEEEITKYPATRTLTLGDTLDAEGSRKQTKKKKKK